MRKTLLFFCLCWTISSLWGAGLGFADSPCTLTVSDTPASGATASNYPVGTFITLTVTVSGTCQPIAQVEYFAQGSTATTSLGKSSAGPTYSVTWNTTVTANDTYNVYAVASFAGSVGGPVVTPVTIDMVGSASFPANPYPGNPALDVNFGESGCAAPNCWIGGDNQTCSTPTNMSPYYGWTYNGSNPAVPDGTCELGYYPTAVPNTITTLGGDPPPTVDSLDDAMHTLSDFVNFSNAFLSNDVGTLSSTFSTWYPQAAGWVEPSDGNANPQDGRLLSLPATLNTWNGVITNWLNNNYVNSSAWCVPLPNDPSLNSGGNPTSENTYIATNGAANDAKDPNITSQWGDLGYVIACMNYNSGAQVYNGTTQTGSIYNYKQCLNLLTSACPASLPGTACDPAILGRSLAGPAPAFTGSCDVTTAGTFGKWVSDSWTLATNEAPKFALRGAFLTDIYSRAQTMQKIFSQGATTIQNFLSGPAAQLATAYSQNPVGSLPDSVIYGWQDKLPSGGSGGCTALDGVTREGCGHIVKITAYSVGRSGASSLGIQSLLPWVQTKTSGFLGLTRSYTLVNRDGPVYVSVRRWDEDHDSIKFPNQHTMWQFLFHNPNGGTTSKGAGLFQECNGLSIPGCVGANCSVGFGLVSSTLGGLALGNISTADQTALSNAFMLNDRGDGSVDPNATTNPNYCGCLSLVNSRLTNAPESHACVQYIASSSAGGLSSGDSDRDYALKFFDCGSVAQPEDLQNCASLSGGLSGS